VERGCFGESAGRGRAAIVGYCPGPWPDLALPFFKSLKIPGHVMDEKNGNCFTVTIAFLFIFTQLYHFIKACFVV